MIPEMYYEYCMHIGLYLQRRLRCDSVLQYRMRLQQLYLKMYKETYHLNSTTKGKESSQLCK